MARLFAVSKHLQTPRHAQFFAGCSGNRQVKTGLPNGSGARSSCNSGSGGGRNPAKQELHVIWIITARTRSATLGARILMSIFTSRRPRQLANQVGLVRNSLAQSPARLSSKSTAELRQPLRIHRAYISAQNFKWRKREVKDRNSVILSLIYAIKH